MLLGPRGGAVARAAAHAARSRSACSSSRPRRRSSSGVEKGYFKEFGVEPELVYFQAAAPIATALAAGQLDVGATGLTAALYNIVLGGEKLWIVADKGREWPGYPLTAHRRAEGAVGRRRCASIKDLKGKRIGVTQIGSTFHYHIGNILEKDGLTLGRREDRAAPGHAAPRWRR